MVSTAKERAETKTICLVIHSLQAGGMERVMAELATFFATKRWLKVVLILYGIKRDIFYSLPENILIIKPSFAFNNSLRWISTLRTLFYLRSKIRSIRPDAVLSFGEYWNSFLLLSTYGLRRPVYVSDRSQPDKRLGRAHDLLRYILYPTAKGVIAQTAKAREIYTGLYSHRNVEIIGNPVRVIAKKGLADRENIVLMVGRLIKSKNQETLIRLFLEIGKPGWKLVLVGYDHLKQQNLDRLKALVEKLGGDGRVVFAGKQVDVDSFYVRSKIFAFTSLSEGFPNAIAEAMSAGLPVVAFDCVAGPSEMVVDGINGFLVPVNQNALFKQRLRSLMDDDLLRARLGDNAKQMISKFSIENIGNRFLNFLNINQPNR